MTKNKYSKNRIGFPNNQGLYDSNNEHDSCGVGFIVDTNNQSSHDIIKKVFQCYVTLSIEGP